jgi:hypothetical protein
MEPDVFAMKMIELGKKMAEVAALQAELTPYVLEVESHQIVGLTEAAYSGGRNAYDYETRGQTTDQEIIARHTKTIPMETVDAHSVTDWKAVCKEAKLEPIVTKPGVPSVKFNLKQKKK